MRRDAGCSKRADNGALNTGSARCDKYASVRPLLVTMLFAAFAALPAQAAAEPVISPAILSEAAPPDPVVPSKVPAEEPTIWKRDTLTGDWGGPRAALKDKGIDISLNYIGEIHADVSGGLRRGTVYHGRLEFSVDTDLQKLAGWNGASTHFTIFNIHDSGANPEDLVGSLADPSNIDALATTRLFTAWFQQNLLNDRLSVRLGQIAADDEFFISPTASGLINATFGWTGMLGADLHQGGPAYPLATPGVRITVKPTDRFTLLTAVFSGDPAGRNCNGNPQECNKHGVTFSFSGGALLVDELQYAVNQEKTATGLPGVYKLGMWYATADYADQHFGLNSAGGVVSLANPASVGPLNHSGNWGFYGVADQTVARSGERSLNLFVRGGVVPSDRNLVSYHVGGGTGVKGLLAGRADDVLTFGAVYRKISPAAAALDRDVLAASGAIGPIRDAEWQLELSYLAQIAPWLTVQPDLQYIAHPGGNVPDPSNPNFAVKNAFVAGVRSTIKF